MNVAFQLRRRPESAAAVALLFPSRDTAGLLRLCAGLEIDPYGSVFAVSGGFLLKLDRPTSRPFPGTIRLRAISSNLLLPADADLVPALLDDEASGLVRDRGLVFLPWGGVLEFDHRSPLHPSTMVVAERLSERSWRRLPERLPLAERIEEIRVEQVDESPDSVLEAGGEGIGTEMPRPEDTGTASKLLGGAALGAGRGAFWLGRTLGLKGLAALGAQWMGRAVERVPRLGEAILGRQAAALRALLKEFREGDPEQALRHALPLSEPGGARGATLDAGGRLPTHNLAYSLGELLAPSGREPAGLWFGDRDVLAELTREYRKAAEQAIRDGDYRRAAFIHGKLLRDYRMAAHTLLRGGLHHDAAILLLSKLDDPKGAARAFEAAGEVDEAIKLYRQVSDHESAGDLLRRIGEDEQALAEYRLAAQRMIASGSGYLAAGRLMMTKAARADLALAYYHTGWARRPDPNALSCAMNALTLYAEAGATRDLVVLLDEADVFLSPPEYAAEAALFYNVLARLADRDELVASRDDLRDRALLGIATKLRQQATSGVSSGRLVSDLLGQPGIWASALTNDADYAVKVAAKPPRDEPLPLQGRPSPKRFRVGVGLVTAACGASESDEVFIGFEGGEVYCFRPDRAEVVRIAAADDPVAALAASPDGRFVAVLRSLKSHRGVLNSYLRAPDGSYRFVLGISMDDIVNPWLTPILPGEADHVVGVWDGYSLYFLTVPSLVSRGHLSLPRPDADPPAALLLPRPPGQAPAFAAFLHDGRQWCVTEPADGGRPPSEGTRQSTGLYWRPTLPDNHRLRSLTLSWSREGHDHLEVVGLGPHGTLQWAAFQFVDGGLDLLATNSSSHEGGYLASAIIRPGMVAAVTRSHVEWLRCGGGKFSFSFSTEIAIPSAVACFVSRRTAELVIVCDDGFVARVPIPFGP